MINIQAIAEQDFHLIKDFLYEAIYIPENERPHSKDIVHSPELRMYYDGFGNLPGDVGMVAESRGVVVGMAWTRIIPDYGHIDDETPSLSIALCNQFRRQGIGSSLLELLYGQLKKQSFNSASLSCQVANPAYHLYKRQGFVIVKDNKDEVVMRKTL